MDLFNLPESLLLQIFSYLDAKTLLRCGCVCHSWFRITRDSFLWKKLFYREWKIDRSIPIAPGKTSWYREYRRLLYKTPVIETETLIEHAHQVLHVAFSHNGKLFSSSSKDGFIKVWNATYPATIRYSADMKEYHWNYTQFSQFNNSDTLLLVSGVHFGAHTASGEIAVFNLQNEFTLQCRVLNKPYDLFGTWYTDNYLLSGRLHFLGHLVSCSALWLNKACQESESERKPIIKRLFKFLNQNASSIRTIMVANCLHPSPEETTEEPPKSLPRGCANHDEHWSTHSSHSLQDYIIKGNPVSHNALSSSQWQLTNTRRRRSIDFVPPSCGGSLDEKVEFGAESKEACTTQSPIRYSQEYRRMETPQSHFEPIRRDEGASNSGSVLFPWDEDRERDSEEEGPGRDSEEYSDERDSSGGGGRLDEGDQREEDESDESAAADEDSSVILDHREKFLIFTTGSLTYTPHQIGFKRIKPFRFQEMVKETATLSDRLKAAATDQDGSSPNNSLLREEDTIPLYDKIDHIIDLHGHIIGMGLSPDHRYLYVNSRPWPQNYDIERPLSPPPIAQEIDIHVIDLVTLKEVGSKKLDSHKAYTPNDECFFIFLDVSDQYVSSGAEDKHGYLWDRHYGNLLARLPHGDVVNSVAFNPKDEMLVTASDDFTLKVWRSRNRCAQIKHVPLPPTNASSSSSS